MTEEHPSIGVLSERIKNLDTTTNRLEKRLFGNGSPGELGEMKKRIASLEKIVYLIQGIGILAMIAVEAITKYLLH